MSVIALISETYLRCRSTDNRRPNPLRLVEYPAQAIRAWSRLNRNRFVLFGKQSSPYLNLSSENIYSLTIY